MDTVLSGLYIVLIIVALFFVFALVGYFIDLKYPDEVKLKKEEELTDDQKLKIKLAEQGQNKSLGNMVNDANKQGQVVQPQATTVQTPTAAPTAVQPAQNAAQTNQNVLQPTIPTNTGNNVF